MGAYGAKLIFQNSSFLLSLLFGGGGRGDRNYCRALVSYRALPAPSSPKKVSSLDRGGTPDLTFLNAAF